MLEQRSNILMSNKNNIGQQNKLDNNSGIDLSELKIATFINNCSALIIGD